MDILEKYMVYFTDDTSTVLVIDNQLFGIGSLSSKKNLIKSMVEKTSGKQVRILFYAKDTPNGICKHMAQLHLGRTESGRPIVYSFTSVSIHGAITQMCDWISKKFTHSQMPKFSVDGIPYRFDLVTLERWYTQRDVSLKTLLDSLKE